MTTYIFCAYHYHSDNSNFLPSKMKHGEVNRQNCCLIRSSYSVPVAFRGQSTGLGRLLHCRTLSMEHVAQTHTQQHLSIRQRMKHVFNIQLRMRRKGEDIMREEVHLCMQRNRQHGVCVCMGLQQCFLVVLLKPSILICTQYIFLLETFLAL